jgi:hypothetical protein
LKKETLVVGLKELDAKTKPIGDKPPVVKELWLLSCIGLEVELELRSSWRTEE